MRLPGSTLACLLVLHLTVIRHPNPATGQIAVSQKVPGVINNYY